MNTQNEEFRESSFEEELIRRHMSLTEQPNLTLDQILLTLNTLVGVQRLNQRLVTNALRALGATNVPRRSAVDGGKLMRRWNVAFVLQEDVAFTPDEV